MATSKWIVNPEEVKLDGLSWNGHDFWIKVKRRLTVGEARRVATAGWRGVSSRQAKAGEATAPAEISIDWQAQSFSRTMAYLRDWSLADDNDKKLPVNEDVVGALDPDMYDVIEQAITKHVEAMDAEKNAQSGGRAPQAMSA